jgi:hypothetical protein
MNKLQRSIVVFVSPALFALGCFGGESNDATAPECQLDTKNEKTPGYPFDVEVFGKDVMPVVAQKCGTAGCHANPAGNGGLIVWAAAKPGDCDFGKTFNSVVSKIDLTTPVNSRILASVTGGSPTHPFTFQATAPELTILKGFVDTAAKRFTDDGGGTTAPPGPSPYDFKVYQSTIQPMFERCSQGACHNVAAGGFSMKPTPVAESPDMQANFVAVTSRGNLQAPDKSVIYTRATVIHGGGLSKTVDENQSKALLAWIEDAKNNAGSNPNPTCAPITKFNLGVFQSEVLPILSGDLDLNQPGGVGRGAGCMSGACHGTDRGPGALSLVPTAPPDQLLQNFACFSNLQSPSSSEILVCPLNGAGCRRYPHPGQDVLGGATDLNYQKLLAFLYGTQSDKSPLDFAFFVRKINPIFSDNNAVENGAQGRSCSDTIACHGVSVAGQAPPNGSDFGVIAAATTFERLTFNFVQATGFTNFLNPNQSSLFLYPTDEIANRADNPFATGLPHPGGADFATDSVFALQILQWAQGLRPDNQGFQRNWLVVGDFPATQIADQTLIDEPSIIPQIFDRSGGSFNRGEWDGLFAETRNVDLNLAFPRNQTAGRVGYAVSYAINTVPRTIRAQLVIASNNPVRVYVDGNLVSQNDQAGGTTAFLNLGPSGPTFKPVRILIKLLQRQDDQQFSFSAQLRDELGALLTDQSRELVFTLGPNGGI